MIEYLIWTIEHEINALKRKIKADMKTKTIQ